MALCQQCSSQCGSVVLVCNKTATWPYCCFTVILPVSCQRHRRLYYVFKSPPLLSLNGILQPK
uniref:Uncharacterized protein n=1 Tax=Anguilla anguilla TaxID=7936 RepID=A0A0E9T4R4_ANGAN